MLRPGDPEAIGGYPLEARLGSGGMGTVYLARTASGRQVAIKLIHRQYADDEEFRTRFRQEVAAARRVSGAFTAAVVDADPEAEHPWMATTYIAGATLAQRITEDGPLAGPELRTLAVGLTEALRDIHRAGVVHRDLKPSNVVLSPEGPRVIDFGISRAADHQTLTMTGRVIGTPPFMSPEQLLAPRDVGPESDVFSLATLLVYAATGQGPFDADSPYMTAYQVVHEAPALGAVPVALRTVVEPCLAKEPGGRPSAGELLRRLLALPADFGDRAADVRAPRSEPDTRDARAPQGRRAAPDARDSATRVLGRKGTESTAPTTFIGRGLRRRWRSAIAAVVAVAAIAGGVALLRPGQEPAKAEAEAGGEGNGRRTVASSGRALPADFRPWQTKVRPKEGITDELRCVPRATALYCGGGGVVATRLNAADGKAAWTVQSPGFPVQGMHLVGVTGSDPASRGGDAPASGDTSEAGDAPESGGTSGSGDASKGKAPETVVGYRQPADADGPTSSPTEVVALSADRGKELWSAELGSESTALVGRPQDAVLHDDSVLSVDVGQTRIESRQVRTGTTRWTTPFPAGSRCTPYAAPGDRQLYALCAPLAEVRARDVRRPSLRTLDAKSGKLGTAIRLDGRLRPVGALRDGTLVLVEERREGTAFDGYARVALLDPRTGEVTSKPLPQRLGAAASPQAGAAPGLAYGTLYFTSSGGRVSAVDPATGKEKWSRQTGAEQASGPVAAGGALYFSSPSGRVAALDPRDGALLWGTDPRAESSVGEVKAGARIAVTGRAVFVSAADNTLYAFDSGKPPKSS